MGLPWEVPSWILSNRIFPRPAHAAWTAYNVWDGQLFRQHLQLPTGMSNRSRISYGNDVEERMLWREGAFVTGADAVSGNPDSLNRNILYYFDKARGGSGFNRSNWSGNTTTSFDPVLYPTCFTMVFRYPGDSQGFNNSPYLIRQDAASSTTVTFNANTGWATKTAPYDHSMYTGATGTFTATAIKDGRWHIVTLGSLNSSSDRSFIIWDGKFIKQDTGAIYAPDSKWVLGASEVGNYTSGIEILCFFGHWSPYIDTAYQEWGPALHADIWDLFENPRKKFYLKAAGGTIHEGAVTFALSQGLTLSAIATLEAAATLNAQLSEVNAVIADLQESQTLALQKSFTPSAANILGVSLTSLGLSLLDTPDAIVSQDVAQSLALQTSDSHVAELIAEGSIALNVTVNYTPAAQAIFETATTKGISAGLAETAEVLGSFEGAAAFDVSVGQTEAAQVDFETGTSEGADLGLTETAEVLGTQEAALTLTAQKGQTNAVIQQTEGSTTLSKTLSLTSVGQLTVERAISLALQESVVASAIITIEGALSLGQTLDLASQTVVQYSPGIQLEQVHNLLLSVVQQLESQAEFGVVEGLSATAGIVTDVGVSLDIQLDAVANGVIGLFSVTTPNKRKLIIKAAANTLTIQASNTTITVHDND